MRRPARAWYLLATSCAPPRTRPQTLLRAHLLDRLRDGPRPRGDAGGRAGRVRQDHPAGGVARGRGAAPAGGLGDPGRARRRPGRALGLRARGAAPGLPGPGGGGRPAARRGGLRRRRRAAAPAQRAGRPGGRDADPGRLPPPLARARRATAWAGSSSAPPRPSAWCWRPAASRGCTWRRCGPGASCWRSAWTTCASRPEEAAEFLNARLGLGLAPADVAGLVARTEGWPAGLYLRGALAAPAGRRRRPARLRGGVRGLPPARGRLPVARGPGHARAGAAGPDAARLGPGERLRLAGGRPHGAARDGGAAGRAGGDEPLPAAPGRPPGVVPLPPPVRGAAARRARAARAGPGAGAAPAGVPLVPRPRAAGPGDSTTPSRPARSGRRPGCSRRPGRPT